MKITLKQFPTHIAKTNNKIAPNKMLKINNQAIYNGYVNRFTRNIVMNNLHNYLIPIFKVFSSSPFYSLPIKVTVNIYTVKNHGSISMRKGKLCWKPAKASYIPNWDIDNLASIWIKAINDSLVKSKLLPDDTIEYIKGGCYNYHEVKDIKDRKIEIIIK